MWSEALRLLEQADRLHRQFFLAREPASWEPPLDIAEGGDGLRLQLALPGVQPDAVSAIRGFPHRESQIHCGEIPFGKFERRIPLQMNEVKLVAKTLQDGILTLTFRRKEGA